MKLTRKTLKEIIKEVIAETDADPQILKKNKEVAHNWATHMEWKSSTDKEKYGDVDDSDEYLHKRRQAVTKAVKKESKSLKDVGGVVGIPALGDMIRKK